MSNGSQKMKTYEETLAFVKQIHAYPDRSGIPYWYHCLGVATIAYNMALAMGMGKEIANMVRLAGLLHDSIEDTAENRVSLLRKGFSPKVILLVSILTHKPNESYEQYINRIIETDNLAAIIVKLADNMHNYSRPNGTKAGKRKYEKSMKKLQKALETWNA